MPTTLPDTSAVVKPEPEFYAVVPVKVLRCKNLPPSAKFLYGDIFALCSVEGFCWASNAYFCARYEVNESTVRRWLAALVKEGFISVQLDGPKRRIYLAESALNEPKSRAKMSGLPAQKCTGYPRKNAPHNITLNKTENNTSKGNRASPSPVVVPPAVKVSAPPPAIDAPPAVRQVERVVAACRDHAARGRLSLLWKIADGAGCADIWQDGLTAVKTPGTRSAGILEPPAAMFVRVVVAALSARGVLVPDGL